MHKKAVEKERYRETLYINSAQKESPILSHNHANVVCQKQREDNCAVLINSATVDIN